MQRMGNIFSGNVLACGAHPDDIEYACFGTLCKLKETCSIFCYVATLGGIGDPTSGENRRIESELSLSLIEPEKMLWGDRIGIHYESYSDIVSTLEQIIYNNDIRLVLTPSKSDSHQDHRLISDITVSALRRSNATLLLYPTLTTIEFNAKVFVDISNVFYKKKKALSMLVSQKNKSYMSDKYLEIFNQDSLASLHGLNYVEKFDIGGMFL